MGLLKPDDYLSSVLAIDANELFAQGFRVVLIDIDNTLVPRDTRVLSDEITAWIARLKKQGLKLCLLSNNWHKTVFSYAEALDIPIVYKAMKPSPFGFIRACAKAGRTKSERVVMIGDQIITDVLGAHIFGAKAILVDPQAVKDLWYTLVFRKLEKRLLRGVNPRK